jgi:hypothetical protein
MAESRFFNGTKFWGNDDLDDSCNDMVMMIMEEKLMIMIHKMLEIYCKFILNIHKAIPEILCGPYCTRGEIMFRLIK